MANGKPMIDIWVVLVVLLIAYAVFPPFQGFVNGLIPQGSSGGTGGTGGTGGGANLPCPIEDVTVTITSNDKYSKATDITNGSHRVFVNGADKGYVSEDGTLTASPNDKIKVIFGENSTSHYSVIKEETVACAGTMLMNAGLANMDAQPSYTIWTEEGQVASASQNQTMATSGIYSNPIRIKSDSKYSLGNPDHPDKGNVICMIYNKTAFDSVKIDGADAAPTPNAQSSLSYTSSSCYYIPVIPNDPEDGNDGEWNGDLVTDTSSLFSTHASTTNGYINISLYDTDLDLDADTLDVIYGVEDEDKNDIGHGVYTSGTYLGISV